LGSNSFLAGFSTGASLSSDERAPCIIVFPTPK
jgi:hypothetical protein